MGLEAVNKLYIRYDFDARVHGINVRCDGTKGYSIIQSDGSCDAYEYAEAFNRIMLVVKSGTDALITFGNDFFIGNGEGRSYGRLIRNWAGGKLTCVAWDERGNLISKMDHDGNVTERAFAKMVLDVMISAHREAEAEVKIESETKS